MPAEATELHQTSEGAAEIQGQVLTGNKLLEGAVNSWRWGNFQVGKGRQGTGIDSAPAGSEFLWLQNRYEASDYIPGKATHKPGGGRPPGQLKLHSCQPQDALCSPKEDNQVPTPRIIWPGPDLWTRTPRDGGRGGAGHAVSPASPQTRPAPGPSPGLPRSSGVPTPGARASGTQNVKTRQGSGKGGARGGWGKLPELE